ncbi:MAG: hypothetical protein WC028_05895 [Candidatus Obscuribacterales bacterium]|jgi:membrane-associated protease RseP (regulator of RpoE activity)
MFEEIYWAIFIIGYAIALAFNADGHILAAQIAGVLTTLFAIGYWTCRYISWRRHNNKKITRKEHL